MLSIINLMSIVETQESSREKGVLPVPHADSESFASVLAENKNSE
jgi:hypothetical protein